MNSDPESHYLRIFLNNSQLEEQRDFHLYCDVPAFPSAGPTHLQMKRARHIFTSSVVGSSLSEHLLLEPRASCSQTLAGTRAAELPNNGRGR